MSGKDNEKPGHAIQSEWVPQLAEHPRCVAMSAIEHSIADGVRHVRWHKQAVNPPRRTICHLATHITFVRLCGPNAQRHFVDLVAAGSAIQRAVQLAQGPNYSPVEKTLMDALPRGREWKIIARPATISTTVGRIARHRRLRSVITIPARIGVWDLGNARFCDCARIRIIDILITVVPHQLPSFVRNRRLAAIWPGPQLVKFLF